MEFQTGQAYSKFGYITVQKQFGTLKGKKCTKLLYVHCDTKKLTEITALF